MSSCPCWSYTNAGGTEIYASSVLNLQVRPLNSRPLGANESSMNYLQVLTRYKLWADNLFLSVVSELPASELSAPCPIFFGSLIRTLNHSFAMDYVWQSHLLGKPHGLTTRNPEHCPEMEALATAQREIDNWYVTYADSLSDSNLSEIVKFEFIGGGNGVMSRRDILFHVVNHTTYHRGHAADILYHLNRFPPTTDLPVFLKEQSVGT
jgi:uncharacterized damage-inducible protein DinB